MTRQDEERLQKLQELNRSDSLVQKELDRCKKRRDEPRLVIHKPRKIRFPLLDFDYSELEIRLLQRSLSEISERERRGPSSGRIWKQNTVNWLRGRERKKWTKRG